MEEIKTKTTYVPSYITSFTQLDQHLQVNQLKESLYDLMVQYIELIDNILENTAYGVVDFPDAYYYDASYAVILIEKVTKEFLTRLTNLSAVSYIKKEKRDRLSLNSLVTWSVIKENKIVDQQFGIVKSIDNDLVLLTLSDKNGNILKEAPETITKHIGEIQFIRTIEFQNDSFTLYKELDSGVLRWFGIPTNIYKDDDNPPDIIKESAHLDFIERVETGKTSYPELWVWHLKKAVGSTDFIGYDERGFVMASGEIFPEFEELVVNLVTNTPDIGMSHGMPITTVAKDSSGKIATYDSAEYTLLPRSNAANKFTKYGVD